MHARKSGAMIVGALLATLALSSPAMTAGPGGGGGGGGGGGEDTGSLYADLVIALRDVNGAPILVKYVVPATAETEETTEYCVQPVSYEAIPGEPWTTNPVDGRQVWLVPLQGEWISDPSPPIPLDEIGPCDPQPAYAMFASEVELERLNLTRTSDEVIAQKLADVALKLGFADVIALESTGRISFDGTPIDASPENAAIYQSLMLTGTIPGLPDDMAGPPAVIGPASATSNSQFDAWELAAMTIGAATSKSTPVNIDTVEYYNRIVAFPPDDPTATPPVVYTSPWGVSFVSSDDPDNPGTPLAGSERFVDYSGFTYNRSETFKGSITWLDVPTLTWNVSRILDVVPFTNLSNLPEIGTQNLTGVTAFAQLADDVRALCNFIPDNTYIPGFVMDAPGVDTTAAQLQAISEPAVQLGPLPELVFRTYPFQATASLQNPWGGDLVPAARLRLTVDAAGELAAGDVTATATDGQSVPFTVDAGNLVGWWGPASGFPVPAGYNVSTTFDVTVGNSAPLGAYDLTLDLVSTTDPDPANFLARDTGVLTVNDNVATVLWGEPVVRYATQGSAVRLPIVVYSPDSRTGQLALTVAGPEALAVGDASVYGSTGSAMAAMPLSLDAAGALVGTWDAALSGGYNPVTLYVTVAEGAIVGDYAFGVALDGGNAVEPAVVAIFAPESHGEQPPGSGEDTTPPVVSITSGTIEGTTATFAFIADDDGTTFECQLDMDGATGDKEACTSPKTYTALASGSYVFAVVGTNREGLVSTQPASMAFVIGEPPVDTTPPTVTITPIGVLGSTAQFELTADEPAVTFVCALTKSNGPTAAFEPCTSPVTFSNLKPATYTLSVQGTDVAGNQSDVVTSDPWTVTRGGRP